MSFVSLSEEKRLRASLERRTTDELRELIKVSLLFSVQAVAKQIIAERDKGNNIWECDECRFTTADENAANTPGAHHSDVCSLYEVNNDAEDDGA